MKENSQELFDIISSESKNLINQVSKNEIKNNNYDIKPNYFQQEKNNKISIDIKEENNHFGLKQEEIIKAKENSFILLGKTGVGKSSLLNIIYGKDIAKIGHTTLSETKNSKYYCIKEKINEEIFYFCVIDTPGLYDTRGVEADSKQKNEIISLISRENIKLKGLLFLSNFQSERLDASEQYTLIDYIKMFPLKDFWKRIIFVFTHNFGDPNGYSKEEIKENNNIYRAEILHNIMLKVKDICEPIQYQKLNLRYVNIINRNLKEEKIKNNLQIRKEIVGEIIRYTKLKPMFNKVQIFNFENYEIEKGDKYLYNCDLYIYLDSENKIIHQEFHIKDRILKNSGKNGEQKVKLNIEDCDVNEEGNLIKRTTKKEGIKEIFDNYQGEIGGGLTIISLIAVVCSGFFFTFGIPVSLLSMAGGVFLWNKNRVNKEEDKKRIEKKLFKEKIIELIKNELKKFNQ